MERLYLYRSPNPDKPVGCRVQGTVFSFCTLCRDNCSLRYSAIRNTNFITKAL